MFSAKRFRLLEILLSYWTQFPLGSNDEDWYGCLSKVLQVEHTIRVSVKSAC